MVLNTDRTVSMRLLYENDLWHPEHKTVPARRIEAIRRNFVIFSENCSQGKDQENKKIPYDDFLYWIIMNKASVERVEVSDTDMETGSPSLTLGKKIAYIRKRNGMTQEDLGRALGLSRSAVALMETGRSCSARSTVFKIAKIFDIKPEFFLCGDGRTQTVTVTEDEQNLLGLYRMLTIPAKIDAQQYIERRNKE
ncbi:helix-turn-helix domain-containing protein [Acetobacter indonesiensis]